MLLNESLTYLVNHTASVVNKGQLGTSTTVASATDTGLISPDATTLTDATASISGNQVIFEFIKTSAVGVGTTYSEYGLIDSVNAVDWTRYVMTALTATAYEDWIIKVRLYYTAI
jgi:hypothetical protein